MDNKDNKIRKWWKDFLMTIIATTLSIVLTFGTAALVDRNKEANSRRQMAMSILDAYKQEMLENVMRLQKAQERTADGK